MAAAADIVENYIKDNAVTVFSKTYCPYCIRAKSLLDSLNVKYQAIELDHLSNGSDIQNYLHQKSGQRTVPNIYINQEHVGGCDDLHEAHANGTLKKLLKA
ncbi:glutaredoxin-C2 [Chytridium lagenaria]|nr:glutaredoxin-C2 [Chytridium lagenaria]